MKQKPALELSDAQRMLAAARAEAEKNKWAVTICIVDEAGYPLILEKADGAPLPSTSIALGKAKAAALSRTSTKVLEDVIKERPAVATFPDRIPVQGGVPLVAGGVCVGGIGVSGVKSSEDEQVALAGSAVLAA